MSEEYDQSKHGRKKTLCPVCLTLGFIVEIENHMRTRHDDYMKRHNINDKAFRTIETNASRLRSDKFVAYTWPEYVGVKEEEVNFVPKEKDYELLKLVINKAQYKAEIMKMMVGISKAASQREPTKYSQFTSITASKFIEICLNEKKLSCECFIYEWLSKE